MAVPFAFNKYELSDDAKAELDKFAGEVKSGRRFFIAVEGYTDSTGSKAYNEALSRRRADQVVEYLVAKHDIPIYRIHMIGLGQEKPVDDARNREARAKNRRVEVKVFNADQVTASLNSTNVETLTRRTVSRQLPPLHRIRSSSVSSVNVTSRRVLARGRAAFLFGDGLTGLLRGLVPKGLPPDVESGRGWLPSTRSLGQHRHQVWRHVAKRPARSRSP